MNSSIKNLAKHFHKRKGRPKNFPLIYKNFKGAKHPYVWCKIIDFYDHKVAIEFYGGTVIITDLSKFIENYKDWESKGFPNMPYHDETLNDNF